MDRLQRRQRIALTGLVGVVLATGCTTAAEPLEWADIDGTYSGSFLAANPEAGDTLTGRMSMTIRRGQLSRLHATYEFEGEATDPDYGRLTAYVRGRVDGGMDEGIDPNVRLPFAEDLEGNVSILGFDGRYDTANARLLLSATAVNVWPRSGCHAFDCTVVQSFERISMTLEREG